MGFTVVWNILCHFQWWDYFGLCQEPIQLTSHYGTTSRRKKLFSRSQLEINDARETIDKYGTMRKIPKHNTRTLETLQDECYYVDS